MEHMAGVVMVNRITVRIRITTVTRVFVFLGVIIKGIPDVFTSAVGQVFDPWQDQRGGFTGGIRGAFHQRLTIGFGFDWNHSDRA